MYIPPELFDVYNKYGKESWPVSEIIAAFQAHNPGKKRNPLWYVNRNYIIYTQCGAHRMCRLSDFSLRRIKAEDYIKTPERIVKMYEDCNSSYKVAYELGISASAVRNICRRFKEGKQIAELENES